MALDKAFLKQRLKLLQDNMATRTTNPEGARQDYADEFVDMLYDFLTGAEVTGNVTTTGSASTQTGGLQNGRLR